MLVDYYFVVGGIAVTVSLAAIGLVLSTRRSLGRLVKTTGEESWDKILTELVNHLENSKKAQGELEVLLSKHIDEAKFHIQKVGMVRFNPFAETGGDQSFTLAILDGHKNGFVISSLHSRDQTRMYAKPVSAGKGDGFELSKEERKAITAALK